MTYEEYINEIEDFDDVTKQELLADFQSHLPLDNPAMMQQMGYGGFEGFLKTKNDAGVMQLGETIRGMSNVSPLVAMKLTNQKSGDIKDKYFIDAFKDKYDDFDIVIDPGCNVNEEYLKQNFTKKTFNYFIDDDGKKGETSGDTKVNFIIFITKDENKIKEAYQCLKPSKNEIILFIEDNAGDNNGQLILAKADEGVKKVFKQVSQRTLNDYKPFHDMQGILKLDYKDWIALILNGKLEGKQLAVEDIIGSLLNVIKTLFLPSKALGWILNKIGDGIDYLKISDTIWDTQSDDYFFEKKNITSFFTIDTAPLAELKKAIVNDPRQLEWNDLLPSFISDNAEIYISKLQNVIGNYNTHITQQIEAIYNFQEQADPIIDILNIKESIAFWVGMWNGLVDFVSSIFKFVGMVLEAPFEIFDNFDKIVDGISQLFTSLSNIDISDELVKAYANIKKYLSEKDADDVDWIRVAYISGFGLMFILTFFIPYANIAKLASIGKFGKMGVIIAEVLEGTGKALGKAVQAVTREAKELASDIWRALTSLMEILKRGGAKLQELFEKISKEIVDWFLKNKKALSLYEGGIFRSRLAKAVAMALDDAPKFIKQYERAFLEMEALLEREMAAIITESGETIGAITDGAKKSVDLSKYFKKLKNAIVTHNHPMGSSLSPGDIMMFMDHGIKELRAIAMTDGVVFSLKRIGNLTSKNIKEVKEAVEIAVKELLKDGPVEKYALERYKADMYIRELNKTGKIKYVKYQP
ncbi:MAG: hypothetical protein K0R77_3097 [Chryseobacterium sp.]|jgi:hypothetical protein|uniref:hypothetical protein n=1 Tax=Chryseobacterium sp. TaxID=1871047 RepID=UPI00261B05E8|nr:hypothetical protein [Chryseobacterium sp.]MDF2553822.1 hypothetical protein [Chryseobacterium sp.]